MCLHLHVRTFRDSHVTRVFQVYLPCVLQTKKRYVGYMYESLDQKEPVFDAKGIETVRRDGCPAVSKVTGKPSSPLGVGRQISFVVVKTLVLGYVSNLLLRPLSFPAIDLLPAQTCSVHQA